MLWCIFPVAYRSGRDLNINCDVFVWNEIIWMSYRRSRQNWTIVYSFLYIIPMLNWNSNTDDSIFIKAVVIGVLKQQLSQKRQRLVIKNSFRLTSFPNVFTNKTRKASWCTSQTHYSFHLETFLTMNRIISKDVTQFPRTLTFTR